MPGCFVSVSQQTVGNVHIQEIVWLDLVRLGEESLKYIIVELNLQIIQNSRI